jgi:monoamine oxidase
MVRSLLMSMGQFEPEQLKNLEHVRDHIQSLSLRPEKLSREDDNMTLDQYVRQLGANNNTSQLVNVWSKVMHGVESTQQSAAFFIDYCRRNKGLLAIRADDHTGGQYLRLPDGKIQLNTRHTTWLAWLIM